MDENTFCLGFGAIENHFAFGADVSARHRHFSRRIVLHNNCVTDKKCSQIMTVERGKGKKIDLRIVLRQRHFSFTLRLFTNSWILQ